MGKLDYPILKTGPFDFVDSGDSQGHRQRLTMSLLSGQAVSNRRVGKNHDKFKELQRHLLDLKKQKVKKLGQKCNTLNFHKNLKFAN
jgi:hypothetical protein